MEHMNKLRYGHARTMSFAEVVTAWLYRVVRRLAGASLRQVLAGTQGRRILIAGLVVFTLVVEFIMLYTLAELVELCISLMELWTELARKHLEITLDSTV